MINLLAFPLLAAIVGYLLGIAAIRWYVAKNPLEAEITNLLPNGQCGQCGFPGCSEAAKAMVANELPANGCPLCSSMVNNQIAEKLGVTLSADGDKAVGMVAGIDTEKCDGCGRCLKQCPFDAIIGAPKQLHGIVADACTGCEQCIAVCPHDGIALYQDPHLINPMPKPSLHSLQLEESHV